jgi:very-short-patch-repair endonuclease
MSDPHRNLRTTRARTLRRDQTDAERKLWRLISNRQLGGVKFRRQYPIDRYFVDFACREASLVVEVDGGQHAINAAYDAERTEALARAGWRVIRFWNNQVMDEPIGVLDVILAELKLARS